MLIIMPAGIGEYSDVRAHSFSQIVNAWNELPTELVTTPTLSVFKRLFDSFHSNIFYNT